MRLCDGAAHGLFDGSGHVDGSALSFGAHLVMVVPSLSVCCMSSGRDPARLAAILSLLDGIADEIVVAVEEPRAIEAFDALASVADTVLTFTPTRPSDRPISWLFGACSGRWIFNIDDDEVPSPGLVAALPELVCRGDVTHYWVARRWLYGTVQTQIAQPPWSTEFQLRLVLADERFTQFSDEFHRPVVCHGPSRFVDAPLWHLDSLVQPIERRRAKALAYELERPGMRIGGLAHNHGLYLPELQTDLALAAVPREDQETIDAVMAGECAPSPAPRNAKLVYATESQVDQRWPGKPFTPRLHRGSLSVTRAPAPMTAGVQQTVDVWVTNDGDRTWRWGEDGRPEIRLGYRWSKDGHPAAEPLALRTPLPADLNPGERQLVPVHVRPPQEPGVYQLELDLLHEGVRRFGLGVIDDVAVSARPQLAVIGEPDSVVRMLHQLGPAPSVEPVVVLRDDVDRSRYGDYRCVPGPRGYLLGGTDDSRNLWLLVPLLTRSCRLVIAARRARNSARDTTASYGQLLRQLRQSDALVVCGTDWLPSAAAGREWWRLITTMFVARTIGVPVLYAPSLVPAGTGRRETILRHLITRLGNPVAPAAATPEPPTPQLLEDSQREAPVR